MKCECGQISTVLRENEDGTVTPLCELCWLNPKYEEEDNENDRDCIKGN